MTTDSLIDAFNLRRNRYVFLIGGGGKTTVLRTLVRHLSQSGKTAIATTSTHTMRPPADFCECVIVEDRLPEAVEKVRSALRSQRLVTLGKTLVTPDDKLSGFSAEQLDALRRAQVADYILVEADGSAGRPLKAHNAYEPVLSAAADLVIAVVGIGCIGRPLTKQHVHRPDRFQSLVGRAIGERVTPEDVAKIILHPLGYLKDVPAGAEVMVLVTKVRSPEDRRTSCQLAEVLAAEDRGGRIDRVVLGEFTGRGPHLEIHGGGSYQGRPRGIRDR